MASAITAPLPVFGGPSKYASWADEMDEVDPIMTSPITTSLPVFGDAKYASWADEMDEVDPITTSPIITPLPIFDAPKFASWADEMDDADPIVTPPPSIITKPGNKPKKTVRFAMWDTEVFEVPADEEARKMDPRYLRPQWRDVDDDTDDEEDEEDEYDEYEGCAY